MTHPSMHPHEIVRAIGPALPSFGRELMQHVADRPCIPVGMILDQDNHPHPVIVVFELRDAGTLVAAIQEWADRNGMRYALDAATDQGRAWARSTPR